MGEGETLRNFAQGTMVNRGILRDIFCRKMIVNTLYPIEEKLQKFTIFPSRDVYPFLNVRT